MLLLVLAHGNEVCMVDKNVDGHQRRIREESGVYLSVGLVAAYLPFNLVGVGGDSERLAGLVLEGGGAHEFADSGMHVHQQIHLGNLRDIALHIDDVFLRVETGSEIFGKDLLHVLM